LSGSYFLVLPLFFVTFASSRYSLLRHYLRDMRDDFGTIGWAWWACCGLVNMQAAVRRLDVANKKTAGANRKNSVVTLHMLI